MQYASLLQVKLLTKLQRPICAPEPHKNAVSVTVTTCSIYVPGRNSANSEDDGSAVLRNVGVKPWILTVSKSIRFAYVNNRIRRSIYTKNKLIVSFRGSIFCFFWLLIFAVTMDKTSVKVSKGQNFERKSLRKCPKFSSHAFIWHEEMCFKCDEKNYVPSFSFLHPLLAFSSVLRSFFLN
jgi:hypothetical protein